MSHMRPGPAEVRRDALVLAAVAAFLFLFFLGARDLWNPNEPIYGLAVREMAEEGEWLIPTVNGRVFTEKPILYFWMARVSSKLLGAVNEFTLRLPCAAAGIASTVMLYLLVFPYSNRNRARIAALLFVTVYMVFWGSRAIQMDILVLAATLGTLLPVSRVLDHGMSPWKGWTLAGIAVGLGFAAKGPVAVVLPGVTYLAYVLATRRPRLVVHKGMLAGGLAAVAVASPWYLALALQGRTDFLYEVLIRQNFVRFYEPWDHQAPWWYYLRYFWIDMAPWAFLVPLAVRMPGRDEEERRLDLLAWTWLIGTIAFFSLSESKRSAYILPVAPAVAVLASSVAVRLLLGTLPRLRRSAALVIFIALATVMAGAGFLIEMRVAGNWPDLAGPARACAVVLIAGGLATAAGMLGRGGVALRVAAGLFAAVLCFYFVAAVWALPAVDRFKSARTFADEMNTVVEADAPVVSYRFWPWRSEYAFYSHRKIRNLDSGDELRAYWEERGNEPVYLIVEEHHLEEVRQVLGGAEPMLERRIGSKTAYLIGGNE
jgi:4-amino-4-deoxy-L-arabinose transferase-like glycosyltransferase